MRFGMLYAIRDGMRKTPLYLSALIAGAFASTSIAAGFALSEESARGNAMQGALVGSTRDVSAIFYNPANLTELEGDGIHTMLGITLARPDYNVRALGRLTDQKESIFPLPHFYIGGKLADSLYWGFGEYIEYGLGTQYEGRKSWPLAADSSKTKITCFTLSPTLAWQATDSLSLGAGFRALYMELISDRMVPQMGSYFHLKADDWAYSYLLSASYKLSESLKLGVVYRGESKFEHEGDVSLSPLGIDTDVTGDLTMPQSVMLGLNWQTTERLNLGFAATWTGWSCLKSIDMDFASPALPDQSSPQKWHDTWRFSFGAEYAINENWAVQAGYTHDFDPTDAGYANTLCPPGDRDQIGAGFSYAKDDWKIALDYMLVIIHETDRIIHGVPAQYRDLRTDTLGFSYSKTF